jgi:hypothetical protein
MRLLLFLLKCGIPILIVRNLIAYKQNEKKQLKKSFRKTKKIFHACGEFHRPADPNRFPLWHPPPYNPLFAHFPTYT